MVVLKNSTHCVRSFRKHPSLSLVFALIWLCCASARAQRFSNTADSRPNSLGSLATDFWKWRSEHQPFTKDDIPRVERPHGSRDWSSNSIRRQRRALKDFELRWHNIHSKQLGIAETVDYRLIGSAIARVRWELDLNRRWERDPTFYLDQTLTAVLESLVQPEPFDSVRRREIITRMEEIPGILMSARRNLHPVRAFAQVAIDSLQNIRPELLRVQRQVAPLLQENSTHGDDQASRFRKATETATMALESYRDWLESHLDTDSVSAAVGRGNYQFFLNNVALVPYDLDQLLAISHQEYKRAVTFEQLEKVRNQGLPELRIFSSVDAQIEKTASDELVIRDFLQRKRILSVPQEIGHYTVNRAPDYLEALADFGELDDFLHKTGVRWISPPSQSLGYFWLATSKDPIPDMVHEGCPGHFFQLSWSRMHEDTIRRHYYDSGANEGLGFYAEEMMLQQGLFDSNPRSREIVYNFMRLRALRVEVDVKLAVGIFTIPQAAQYLAHRVPMDNKTAESEAASFATQPGHAISYQIGKTQIIDFLADARLKQGSAFDLRAFHDFLWKNGNVPQSLLRWEYLGLDDQVRKIDSSLPQERKARALD